MIFLMTKTSAKHVAIAENTQNSINDRFLNVKEILIILRKINFIFDKVSTKCFPPKKNKIKKIIYNYKNEKKKFIRET